MEIIIHFTCESTPNTHKVFGGSDLRIATKRFGSRESEFPTTNP